MTILQKIKSWFGGEESPPPAYELVERKLAEDQFRQGIRILIGKYAGVVVTISPKVGIDVDDNGMVMVSFEETIEYVPSGIVIDKHELHSVVGDCVVDIISKDYDADRDVDIERSG